MAIEFNGKGNIDKLKIGQEIPEKRKTVNQEKEIDVKPQIDNKFVKELGDDLLKVNPANDFSINFKSANETKIDKDFWGDALNGLNLKETALTQETTKGISQLNQVFDEIDMENKMKQSKFMKALNKEFGIE